MADVISQTWQWQFEDNIEHSTLCLSTRYNATELGH